MYASCSVEGPGTEQGMRVAWREIRSLDIEPGRCKSGINAPTVGVRRWPSGEEITPRAGSCVSGGSLGTDSKCALRKQDHANAPILHRLICCRHLSEVAKLDTFVNKCPGNLFEEFGLIARAETLHTIRL